MSVADFSDIPDDYAFDDPSIAGGEGQSEQPIDPYVHPWVVFFHIIFKICAMVIYLVLYYTVKNFVLTFIFTVVFLAVDFWTCKNVSGRLLVGLRWWNAIKEDGTSEWIFESRADRTKIHRGEAGTFWTSLIVFTLVWLAFSIKNLIGPEWAWLTLDLIALALCGANLIGYLKCARAARQLTDAASNYVVQQAVGRATSRFTGAGQPDNV